MEPNANLPAPEATPDLSAQLTSAIGAAEAAAKTTPTPDPVHKPTPEAQPAVPTQPFAVREYLKAQGYDPSAFQDDQSAVAALIQGAQALQNRTKQLEEMAGYGQQVLPYLSEFEKWRQSQAQAAQPPAKQGYKAPEYDPKWSNQLGLDEQGNVVPKPGTGASVETVQKYLKWQQHQREFTDRLVQNPLNTLKEVGIEDLIEAKVRERIDGSLGQLKDRQFADNFVRENSPWLHQKDQTGRIVGLSPAGHRYAEHVQSLERSGVKDVNQQANIAKQMVQSELLSQWYAQQNAANQGQQPRQVIPGLPNPAPQVGTHQPGANRLAQLQGSLAPTNLNGTEPSQNSQLNLVQRLRNELQANGITDQHLLQGVG